MCTNEGRGEPGLEGETILASGEIRRILGKMPAREPVNLKEKVRRLPDKPGVYLMKDRLGRIIYIGKAKNLKKRVSSYFQPSRSFGISQPKIRALISLITDFDTIDVK